MPSTTATARAWSTVAGLTAEAAGRGGGPGTAPFAGAHIRSEGPPHGRDHPHDAAVPGTPDRYGSTSSLWRLVTSMPSPKPPIHGMVSAGTSYDAVNVARAQRVKFCRPLSLIRAFSGSRPKASTVARP